VSSNSAPMAAPTSVPAISVASTADISVNVQDAEPPVPAVPTPTAAVSATPPATNPSNNDDLSAPVTSASACDVSPQTSEVSSSATNTPVDSSESTVVPSSPEIAQANAVTSNEIAGRQFSLAGDVIPANDVGVTTHFFVGNTSVATQLASGMHLEKLSPV